MDDIYNVSEFNDTLEDVFWGEITEKERIIAENDLNQLSVTESRIADNCLNDIQEVIEEEETELSKELSEDLCCEPLDSEADHFVAKDLSASTTNQNFTTISYNNTTTIENVLSAIESNANHSGICDEVFDDTHNDTNLMINDQNNEQLIDIDWFNESKRSIKSKSNGRTGTPLFRYLTTSVSKRKRLEPNLLSPFVTTRNKSLLNYEKQEKRDSSLGLLNNSFINFSADLTDSNEIDSNTKQTPTLIHF